MHLSGLPIVHVMGEAIQIWEMWRVIPAFDQLTFRIHPMEAIGDDLNAALLSHPKVFSEFQHAVVHHRHSGPDEPILDGQPFLADEKMQDMRICY
jgi:hypothetical protein